MKKFPTLIVGILLFIPLISNTALAQDFDENVTVVVEPTIHIDVEVTDCTGSGDSTMKMEAGEYGDCTISMENYGNTEYDVELRGPLDETELGGWINWDFDCPDLGDCSDTHADSQYYTPPEIREINLGPGQETHFIMNSMLGLTDDEATINIQVKDLEEDEGSEEWQNMENITVETGDEMTDDYGPFIAPAYTNFSLIALIILSSTIFSLTKVR